jgi:hypothetical protein
VLKVEVFGSSETVQMPATCSISQKKATFITEAVNAYRSENFCPEVTDNNFLRNISRLLANYTESYLSAKVDINSPSSGGHSVDIALLRTEYHGVR